MKARPLLIALGVWIQLSGPIFSQEIPVFAPTREGLHHMLEFILEATDAQQRALTDSLQPQQGEYDSLFFFPYSKKVFRYHKRLRKMADIVIRPIWDSQTEILLWEATPESLKAYTGDARGFPGAYSEYAHYFKPGYTFYRVKFVQPDRKLGTAFDLFVYVNRHWRLFHRPWAVMK